MALPRNEISLVYLSAATCPFSRQDFIELLTQARESNCALEITGMLLYKDGNFLQVLEGDAGKVQTLYEKIAADKRHTTLKILSHEACKQRDFPDWSMGFHDLGSGEVRPEAFSHFLDSTLTTASFSSDPGRAKKLLLLFKEERLAKVAGAGR